MGNLNGKRVITLQVLNYVTADLYLSDRSRQRLIIFDEAWQFFKEGDMLRDVIEEGYRRARKGNLPPSAASQPAGAQAMTTS